MRLYYNHKLDIYAFECLIYQKNIPKSNGFWWNPSLGVWYTKDLDKAMNLYLYADSETRQFIDECIKQKKKNIVSSQKSETNKVFKSPEGLKYYPFQSAGIEYLINHQKTLLADSCGLGKSIQAIGLINNIEIKKVLIICPNTIKLNWLFELEKWLCRSLSVAVINADKFREADIMILNYDIIEKYKYELSNIPFELIICDESHALKNPKTKKYKAYKEISKNIPRKLFMTGTPILNRPIELWTTIQELCPNEFVNYWNYGREFCDGKKVQTKYNKETRERDTAWDFSGASNLEKLQYKLRSSCLLRRLKHEVMSELPNITRQIIVLDDNTVKDKEKIDLNDIKREYISQVDELETGSLKIFSKLSDMRHKTALKKVPYAIDFINNLLEENDKVIVFAHHKDVIDQLKQKFTDSVVVTGDVSTEDRQKAVKSFQNDKNIRVFIGSIKTSGEGITLTASSTVVFVEFSWVPADVEQCESRSLRIGQKNAVNSYHIVFNGTIDAHLAKTIIRKQEISDKTLDLPINLKEIFGF